MGEINEKKGTPYYSKLIKCGSIMVSSNGMYTADFQCDGNLVVYVSIQFIIMIAWRKNL